MATVAGAAPSGTDLGGEARLLVDASVTFSPNGADGGAALRWRAKFCSHADPTDGCLGAAPVLLRTGWGAEWGAGPEWDMGPEWAMGTRCPCAALGLAGGATVGAENVCPWLRAGAASTTLIFFCIGWLLISDRSMPPTGRYEKGFLSLVAMAFWIAAGASRCCV